MRHGSLFTGVGGFEEGAKMSGIETIWNCEYEVFQRAVLKKKYPESYQYADVRELFGPPYVDIISGGFPCQDISVAGKGQGIDGSRSGLWNQMFRICGEVRPKYIVIENSPALLFRGFEQVLCNLSEIGYHAEWQCISNLSFGYPHKRERIYVIAYSDKVRLQSNFCEHGTFGSVFKKWASNSAYGYSLSQRIHEIPKSAVVRTGDGFRSWSHRVGSIGNSVNPTVAHYLFECIKDFDKAIAQTTIQ